MEPNQSPEVVYLKTVQPVDLSDDSHLRHPPKRQRLSEITVGQFSRVEFVLDNSNNACLVFTPGLPEVPDVLKHKLPERTASLRDRVALCPDPTQTVCASFHQNSEGHRLSQYRGNQCTSMALAAIMASNTLPVHKWTSLDMDNVLRFGNRVHKRLVEDPDRKCPGDPRVAIGEIEVGEGSCYTMPMPCENEDWARGPLRKAIVNTLFKSDEYFGNLRQFTRSYLGEVPMETALTEILKNGYQNALITVDDRTGAIIKDERGKLRYFDSHSNIKIGRGHPDGTAVLLSFETVRDFVRHMRRRQCEGAGRFEMFGLNVKSQKPVCVVRPQMRTPSV